MAAPPVAQPSSMALFEWAEGQGIALTNQPAPTAPTATLPTPRAAPRFDGKTYDPAADQDRLKKQLGRVYEVMWDGAWRTLAEIQEACHAFGGHDTEAAISARLRDLRKTKFGSYVVEHRRRGDPKAGLWEYRVAGKNGQRA